MEFTVNKFRKYLIDVVLRETKTTISNAIKQVDDFVLNPKFQEGYEKWVFCQQRRFKNQSRPKSCKEILQGHK